MTTKRAPKYVGSLVLEDETSQFCAAFALIQNYEDTPMDYDIILGMIIIGGGLCFMSYLIFWSRRTIERIARKQPGSIRQILQEFHHGR